jgi:hypothetical protein
MCQAIHCQIFCGRGLSPYSHRRLWYWIAWSIAYNDMWVLSLKNNQGHQKILVVDCLGGQYTSV